MHWVLQSYSHAGRGLLTTGLILISLTVMIVVVFWCNSFIQLVVIGLAHTQVSGCTEQQIVNILCASKQKLSLLSKMLNLSSFLYASLLFALGDCWQPGNS